MAVWNLFGPSRDGAPRAHGGVQNQARAEVAAAAPAPVPMAAPTSFLSRLFGIVINFIVFSLRLLFTVVFLGLVFFSVALLRAGCDPASPVVWSNNTCAGVRAVEGLWSLLVAEGADLSELELLRKEHRRLADEVQRLRPLAIDHELLKQQNEQLKALFRVQSEGIHDLSRQLSTCEARNRNRYPFSWPSVVADVILSWYEPAIVIGNTIGDELAYRRTVAETVGKLVVGDGEATRVLGQAAEALANVNSQQEAMMAEKQKLEDKLVERERELDAVKRAYEFATAISESRLKDFEACRSAAEEDLRVCQLELLEASTRRSAAGDAAVAKAAELVLPVNSTRAPVSNTTEQRASGGRCECEEEAAVAASLSSEKATLESNLAQQASVIEAVKDRFGGALFEEAPSVTSLLGVIRKVHDVILALREREREEPTQPDLANPVSGSRRPDEEVS